MFFNWLVKWLFKIFGFYGFENGNDCVGGL